MKEKDQDNLLLQGESDDSDMNSTRALSMMSGVGGPDGLSDGDLDLGVPRRGKVLNTGTMLVIVLFVIAGGALYTMRAMQSDLTAGTVARELELKVEAALARVMDTSLPEDDPLHQAQLDSLFKDTDSVLNMFSTDPRERQVPPEFVKKNPFVLPAFKSTEESPDEPVKEDNRREKELEREIAKYDLQSVMGGARPVAIINGDLYKVGQTLGNFTITAIDALTVTLEAEGFSHRLSMDSQDGAKFKTPFGR